MSTFNREEAINQPSEKYSELNKPKNEWIFINPSIYLIYCLLNGASIAFGCLFKLLFPMSRESIGKKSILTGIPIIRQYFFVLPIILNITFFIWIIYIYSNEREKSFINYMKKRRSCFFFTNLLLLILFFIIYNNVFGEIFRLYGIKLSGHILASILSGGMIVNLHYSYYPIIEKYKYSNIIYTTYINTFLYYHNIYTIFWSAWIFHQVKELFISYFVSISFLVTIHSINIDELIWNLFDFQYPKKNPKILYK